MVGFLEIDYHLFLSGFAMSLLTILLFRFHCTFLSSVLNDINHFSTAMEGKLAAEIRIVSIHTLQL